MKPVQISPRAEEALAAILAWYEEQRPGLARTFLRDLRHTLEVLASFPAAGRRLTLWRTAWIPDGIRPASVDRGGPARGDVGPPC